MADTTPDELRERTGEQEMESAFLRLVEAMSGRITLATTVRVLAQIRHDHRTIALLLVVPSALLFLLQQLLGDAAVRPPRRPDARACSRSSRCSS